MSRRAHLTSSESPTVSRSDEEALALVKDHYYLQGREVKEWTGSLTDWAKYNYGPNNSNRRVGNDEINGLFVSTVFLGLDHGFGGKPQLFETMIFSSDNRRVDGADGYEYQERCSTYDEAEAMHKRACDYARRFTPTKMDDTREYLKVVGGQND